MILNNTPSYNYLNFLSKILLCNYFESNFVSKSIHFFQHSFITYILKLNLKFFSNNSLSYIIILNYFLNKTYFPLLKQYSRTISLFSRMLQFQPCRRTHNTFSTTTTIFSFDTIIIYQRNKKRNLLPLIQVFHVFQFSSIFPVSR